MAVGLNAQQTIVSQTVTDSTGALVNGSVAITINASCVYNGSLVFNQPITVYFQSGAFNVGLTPNAGGCAGTSYKAMWTFDSVSFAQYSFTQYWSVPVSAAPVSVASVTLSFPVPSPMVRLFSSCQPGLGDGNNVVPAGTYQESTCYNDTSAPVALSAIRCYTDNAGTSALTSVITGSGSSLLASPIVCGPTWVAGTQTSTVVLAAGDFIKFTWVADGVTTQTTWVVSEIKQ